LRGAYNSEGSSCDRRCSRLVFSRHLHGRKRGGGGRKWWKEVNVYLYSNVELCCFSGPRNQCVSREEREENVSITDNTEPFFDSGGGGGGGGGRC